MATDQLPLPPDPHEPAPKSSFRRWLFGCGCGCAVLLLLLILGLGYFGRKMFGPGVQLPSDHILGADSIAAIQLDSPTARAEERAFLIDTMQALVATQIDELQADGASDGEIEQLVTMLEDLDQAGTGGLSSFTMALAPDGDELAMAAALNLDQGAPLMRFLLERIGLSGAVEHERDGVVAYEFDPTADLEGELMVEGPDGDLTAVTSEDIGSFYIGFVQDTAIFSDSKGLLLDTLEATDFDETPGQAPASPLREELDGMRTEWLLAAAMLDHPLLHPADVLAADLQGDDLDLDWCELPYHAARLGMGVDERDMALRLEIDGLDPADLPTVVSGLESLVAVRAEQLAEHGLELAHEVLTGETSLVLEVGLPGFRNWLTERGYEGATGNSGE